MNKLSFDTHLALSEDVDKEKNDYIFVDKPEDLDKQGQLKILGDFLMHPRADEILNKLNKGIRYSLPYNIYPMSGTYIITT